jgi:transcription elongation factor Elf1
MAVYIDRKYLLLAASRLRNFKQKKEDLFNFSCPVCGDSQKNKLKARGYVYRKNNDYFYICHNCQTSTTFSKFLKHIDTDLQRQYVVERYAAGDSGNANYQKPTFNFSGPKPVEKFKSAKNNIKNIGSLGLIDSINDLDSEHYARQYIEDRQIPKQFWSEIFYTDSYKDFLDKTFPDHGNVDVPNDDRIVLFYTNESGEITNVTGRALGNTKVRYCTVKITDEKKVFALHRLQKESRVYVFEGQFDSFFIPNSIASGDSNLGSVASVLSDCEIVLVYDNEPRNREIVKQIGKAVDNNLSVCLFPDSIPFKDINDMICGGMSASEIKNIIDDNTFNGLTAKLKFIEWKKC